MAWLVRIGGSIAMVLAGCGPRVETDADHGEICGEAGPFRVLALEDEELPYPAGVTRAGERLYFTVGDVVREEDAPPSAFGSFIPVGGLPRVWSTGLCGESPRHIADDMLYPREHPRWPGSLVASGSGFDLFALDPEGIAPPHLLVPGLPSALGGDSEVGIVGVLATLGDGSGTLALQPYPEKVTDDPPARIELLDDVVTRLGGVAVRATEALALTTERVIVHIDLTILEKSTLATDVDGFELHEDGRFVALMRAMDPLDPDTLYSTTILDRDNGGETWVADGVDVLTNGIGPRADIIITIVTADGTADRVVELPSLATHDTPTGVTIASRIDDSRFLAWRDEDAVIFDLRTDEATPVFADAYGVTHLEDDALVVLEGATFQDDPYRTERVLWRAPFNGESPMRLADRATVAFELVGDRHVVTALDADEDFLGSLVLVDSQTLDEQRIDDHVFVAGANLEHPLHEDALDDGVIAYGVRDGDRSGIWLAKPISD